ncbi:hypothetical protein PHYSODRAFT_354478 [Phytophthora sojae]|uniref:Uncharacterized protein n=1 Tax=Phytophthora sojae (strain P6497) TaxID=1094619 RepID=G4ZC32_PHYSP|nr:hypothetical protein PHYSODRAFT_354478 [Phytophthora sojae]EGZ22762.1 hypothetical protein PHYSODRAFT_354478 [Phytophthora sojae]|eukprot:XP_009525479.1 hypothetical protein PHYSODRAFT_354478 [Phytophthora sojae]
MLDSDNDDRCEETRPPVTVDTVPDNNARQAPGADATRHEAAAVIGAAVASVCRWKDCKKVNKSNGGGSFRPCSRPGCEREAHAACVAALLDAFGAGGSFDKLRAENDATTPCADNYDRFCGGEGQTGETKTTLAQQIVHMISAKDVMSKIASLKSTFRAAVDWLSATGQGVEDETTPRANILERCPEYYDLFDTMHSRISTRAQLLNTDQHFRKDDTESDDCSSSDESATDTNEVSSHGVSNSAAKRSTSIPISIAQPQTKKPKKNDLSGHPTSNAISNLLNWTSEKKDLGLRERGFLARQQQLKNEDLLAAARIGEANAQATKLREEAEHWSQQRKIALLRERK